MEAEMMEGPFADSQLELEEAIFNGELAEDHDRRSPQERHAELVSIAIELGAVDAG
jgi:hypothetical protein